MIKAAANFCPILLAPAVIFLGQSPASAIFSLNIFEDGANLKVNLVGSLSQLPSPASSGFCGANGALVGQFAPSSTINTATCGGPDSTWSLYSITGPAGFGGTGSLIGASSVSGSSFWFAGSDYTNSPVYESKLGIDPAYVLGSPYFSEAVFNGVTLASQGFNTLGLAGIWTIDGTSESIRVCIGSGGCTTDVPAPLPLLGAGAAFGLARRMRQRIAAPAAKSPQA
jgi:hypothetical protein